MIKLEHVSKAYSAGIPALNDVNLEIDDGEFVFVCGDSGSGKSTLIKLLLKELDPTDGTITVDGRNLTRIRHKQIPKYRRNVGVVFQDFRLLKDRNVYENVAFALKVIGASTAVIKKKGATDAFYGRACCKVQVKAERAFGRRAAESSYCKSSCQ